MKTPKRGSSFMVLFLVLLCTFVGSIRGQGDLQNQAQVTISKPRSTNKMFPQAYSGSTPVSRPTPVYRPTPVPRPTRPTPVYRPTPVPRPTRPMPVPRPTRPAPVQPRPVPRPTRPTPVRPTPKYKSPKPPKSGSSGKSTPPYGGGFHYHYPHYPYNAPIYGGSGSGSGGGGGRGGHSAAVAQTSFGQLLGFSTVIITFATLICFS